MTIVRIEDCRSLKYCTMGVRRFFHKHDMDFNEFITNGLHEDAFPKDDLMAQRVVDEARRRENAAHE